MIFVILFGSTFFIVLIFTVHFFSKEPSRIEMMLNNKKFSVSKLNNQFRFIKDGKPFLVKGGSGFNYIKELSLAGGNTVFCWDTSKIAQTLQEAQRYNMAVIIGLDIPTGDDYSFYKDEKNIEIFYKNYFKIVNKYKNHPALLAWCLGNELEFPSSVLKLPFFKAYNKLLNMIHSLDPVHPVSTAIMNVAKRNLINIRFRIPELDFISINTYNKLKVIKDELQLMKHFWNGPYLIGEWAPNGGWEAQITSWEAPIENSSSKKAEQYNDLFRNYMPINDPRFLGSIAFYWGERQEYTHTWYSSFSDEAMPNEITEVLKDCWNDTITTHLSPKLTFMLIDNLGAFDDIIVSSATSHKVSILLDSTNVKDTLHYKWQLLKEDWLSWGHTWNNFKKIQPEVGLFTDSTLQYTSFKSPLQEGPYRVFVTVYNSKGFCATANTPIYVVE